MAEFTTLDSREIELAKGRLVVAAKRVREGIKESDFIAISKADDNGRFKQMLTLPRDAEIVRKLIDALQSMA